MEEQSWRFGILAFDLSHLFTPLGICGDRVAPGYSREAVLSRIIKDMHGEYIEERNGGYYVVGTRISLDSVVCAFNRGDSPERILERYPLLEKPGRVYGAIAFYLDHQPEVDAYLETSKREFEASAGPPLAQENPQLWDRLQRARAQTGTD